MAIYVVLTLVFVIAAYPFFYVLFLAVMPYENYVRMPIHAWPSGFTLLYFREIFRDPRIVHAFGISLLKTGVGTALSVTTTAMAGFALSRRQLKFGRVLVILFLVPMFFNGGLIPYYLVIRMLGLVNTFWALVIPGMVSSFFLFMARAYYMDFPQEVIEAAVIDGAGQFGVFWRIVWPTSTPILATIALLYGTGQWNDYFWPSILVRENLHPAPVILQSISNTRSVLQGLGLGTRLTPASFVAAVAATLVIPIIVVYPLLQRFVVKGIMIGSVKG